MNNPDRTWRSHDTCPECGADINAGAILAQRTSPAKAQAARVNGRKGGRPRKVKKGKA